MMTELYRQDVKTSENEAITPENKATTREKYTTRIENVATTAENNGTTTVNVATILPYNDKTTTTGKDHFELFEFFCFL